MKTIKKVHGLTSSPEDNFHHMLYTEQSRSKFYVASNSHNFYEGKYLSSKKQYIPYSLP